MTIRQKVLKVIYPVFTGFNRLFGRRSKVILNKQNASPLQSIYDLSVHLNNGNPLLLRTLKGKKILVVNTASDCGYTGQYTELQKLHMLFQHSVVIIGFPANDFRKQERRSNQEIEEFCLLNFGVSFPLANKSVVVRSSQQNDVFRWLTDKNKNGWNDQQPSWNFSKYVIDENGVLKAYFDPAISPLSEDVLRVLRN